MSKHTIYKVSAVFFMLLGLYKMLLDSLFISNQKFGPVTLCLAVSALYRLLSKSALIHKVALLAFQKINYHYQYIILNFIGLEAVKKIGYTNISNYFIWLTSKITSPSVIKSEVYSNITAYLLLILSSALIYIIVIRGYRMLAFVLLTFFILQWHFFIDSSYTNAVFYSAGFIILHADSSLKEKGRYVDNLGFSLYIPTAVFLLVILSVIIPWKVNTIEIQRFSDNMTSRFPVLEKLRDSVEDKVAGAQFELSDTPFQPDISRLGGSVELSNEIIMRVKSDDVYYLRGTVKDEYTGSQWQTSDDRIYLMQGNQFDVDPQSIGYEKNSLTVYPDKLKTRTIFNPYFSYKVTGVDVDLVYNESLEIQRNKGDMNQQNSYNIEFFTPIYRSQRGYSEKEIDNLKLYFQLPPTITERTKSLADNITKDEKGVYDKLSAIEEYLKKTYPYSLSVSELPQNQDFVDYFLFTEEKGYCTYYASAMGVMARSIGIATRYVEGFRMSEEKNSDGEYIIRKSRAHAWIEAYVPGTGWMTFEPTGNLTQQDLLSSNGQNPDDLYDPGNQTDENQGEISESAGSPQEAEGSVYNEKTADKKENTANPYIIFIMIFLLIAAVLFVAGYLIYKRYKFSKMTNSELVVYYYNNIIDITSKNGKAYYINSYYQNLSPAETMDILNEKHLLSKSNLGEYIERLLYSKNSVTDEDIKFMFETYQKAKEISNNGK